jgi:hypothetical protein
MVPIEMTSQLSMFSYGLDVVLIVSTLALLAPRAVQTLRAWFANRPRLALPRPALGHSR